MVEVISKETIPLMILSDYTTNDTLRAPPTWGVEKFLKIKINGKRETSEKFLFISLLGHH